MNVSQKQIDAVNTQIKVELTKSDYQDKVEQALKKIRQKANIPGFRQGMVPMGMIKKMYQTSATVDEVNRLIGQELYSFIKENQLNVLGEPLPNDEEQKPLDFGADHPLEFLFDVALAPEINLSLTQKDVVKYYNIDVTDDLINQQIQALTSRYGQYLQVESSQEKDMIKGRLVELQEDGQAKQDGIRVEEAVLMPSYIKDETTQKLLLNLKSGATVVINPAKAYEGNDVEIASLLKKTKEEVAGLTSDFSFEITEITRYQEAELNQELFDNIFGKDQIKSQEELKAKVAKDLEIQFTPDSDYRFLLDIKDMILNKLSDTLLPEEFLKRWLLSSDEKRTAEGLDQEMPRILEDLKWQLYKEKIVKEQSIQVNEEDLLSVAKMMTKTQFAQYGMPNAPEQLIEGYAKDMLKKEDTARNLADRAIEEKVTQWLKSQVKLNEEKISMEEFNKLFV